ncbi:hypothetical protein ACQP2F_27185 [Actinoplanes sp. CA-030573]|uniref:hypothetical protein n=1 Tax=Actinoplanes sp. CA-030573 TaxID=3239898 RepID=UPI003D93CAA5
MSFRLRGVATAILALAFAPAIVVAGCAGGYQPPPSKGGVEPIVLVQWQPGFSPPGERWALPTFVLLRDGTAFTRAADQGVVMSATRRTLSAEQVAALYARAGDAGLFRDRAFNRDVLDASGLRVRITSAEGRYETTVVQPDPNDGGARGRVARFAEAAVRVGGAGEAYVPERVAVYRLANGGDDSGDVRPWPLPDPRAVGDRSPHAPGFGGDVNRPCQVVAGALLRSLLVAVRTATARTRWTDGGKVLSLFVRPLLPYEEGC